MLAVVLVGFLGRSAGSERYCEIGAFSALSGLLKRLLVAPAPAVCISLLTLGRSFPRPSKKLRISSNPGASFSLLGLERLSELARRLEKGPTFPMLPVKTALSELVPGKFARFGVWSLAA